MGRFDALDAFLAEPLRRTGEGLSPTPTPQEDGLPVVTAAEDRFAELDAFLAGGRPAADNGTDGTQGTGAPVGPHAGGSWKAAVDAQGTQAPEPDEWSALGVGVGVKQAEQDREAREAKAREALAVVLENLPPSVAKKVAQGVYPLEPEGKFVPDEELKALGKIGLWANMVRSVNDGSAKYKLPLVGDMMQLGDVADLVVRWQRLKPTLGREFANDPETGKPMPAGGDYAPGPLGEAQRAQDLRAVGNWAQWAHEEEVRGRSWSAKLLGGIAESAKLAVEMGATAGPGAVAGGAAKAMTRKLIRGELEAAAKWGLKAGLALGKEALPQVARLAPLKMPALAADKLLPQGVEKDPETGEIRAAKEGKSLAQAIVIAALEHTGNVVVEKSGEVLVTPAIEVGKRLAGTAAKRVLETLPAGTQAVATRFAGALQAAAAKARVPFGRVQELLAQGDYAGVGAEVGEERLQAAWNAGVSAIPGLDAELGTPADILYGDPQKGSRLEQFALELGVVLGLKGGAAAVDTASAAVERKLDEGRRQKALAAVREATVGKDMDLPEGGQGKVVGMEDDLTFVLELPDGTLRRLPKSEWSGQGKGTAATETGRRGNGEPARRGDGETAGGRTGETEKGGDGEARPKVGDRVALPQGDGIVTAATPDGQRLTVRLPNGWQGAYSAQELEELRRKGETAPPLPQAGNGTDRTDGPAAAAPAAAAPQPEPAPAGTGTAQAQAPVPTAAPGQATAAERTERTQPTETPAPTLLGLEELPDYARGAIVAESRAVRTNKGRSPDAVDPYAGSLWQRVTLPIAEVEPTPVTFKPRGSMTKGPIVIDMTATVLDGNNRLYEARQRGDATIEAFVQRRVLAAAVDAYGYRLMPGYVREGDAYVFRGVPRPSSPPPAGNGTKGTDGLALATPAAAPVQGAESAPVAAAPKAAPAPKRARQGRGRRPPQPTEETRALQAVLENGGIKHRRLVANPGGEYDGQPEAGALKPFGGRLLKEDGTGLAPDEMAKILHGQGLLPEGDAEALWRRLEGEVAAWNRNEVERQAQEREAGQAERFDGEVRGPQKEGRAVAAEELRTGDVLTRKGERLTVVGLDPDSLAVHLRGGERYGEQTVEAGETLHADTYEPAAEAARPDGGDILFNREPGPAGPVAVSTPEEARAFVAGLRSAPKPRGTRAAASLEPLAVARGMAPATAELPAAETAARVAAVRALAAVPVGAAPASPGEAEAAYRSLGSAPGPDGRPIELVHSAFGKLERHRNGRLILRIVPQIGALLRGSVLAYSETERQPARHRNIAGYHNYVAKAEIDGREYYVRFTVQEVRKENGQELHNAALSDIEMTEAAVAGVHSRIIDEAKAGDVSLDTKLVEWMRSVNRDSQGETPSGPGATEVQEPAAPYADLPALTAERIGGIVPGERTEAEHVEAGKAKYPDGQLQFDFAVSPNAAAAGLDANGAAALPADGMPDPTGNSGTTAGTPAGWHLLHSRLRVGLSAVGRFRLGHTRIDTPQQAAEVLRDMRSGSQEKLVLLPLLDDGRIAPAGMVLLHIGLVDRTNVQASLVLQALRATGAKRFVIAHNHPSGNPSPSSSDLASFSALQSTLEKTNDATMVDALILNGNTFYSIRSSQLLEYGTPPAVARGAVSVLGSFGDQGSEQDTGVSVVDGQTHQPELVSNPQAAATVAMQVIGHSPEIEPPIVLLGLNTRMEVVATAVIPQTVFDPFTAIGHMASLPSINAIVSVWHETAASTWTPAKLQAIKQMVEAGKMVGVEVRDVLNLNPATGAMQNAYASGLMEARKPYTATDTTLAEMPSPGDDVPSGQAPAEVARPVLQLHDLVRLADMLMEGGIPKVVEKIRLAHGTALGAFYPRGEGEIALRADIFVGPQLLQVILPRNAEQAQATEAELLARLRETEPAAGDGDTGAQGELVVRRKAYKGGVLLSVYRRDHGYVLRTLAHEIGHLFDWLDDKSLARGNILGHIAALNKYMASMIQDTPENPRERISDSERQTLRNQAYRHVRATTTLDPKKQGKVFKGAVTKRYHELLDEWLRTNGMVSRAALVEELRGLSQWWKPFDVAADPGYTEYRWKPAELYADAMSVLLNAPQELAARAPLFDRMWRGYLEARPAAAESWRMVQEELLAGPDVGIGKLRRRVQEGFRKGDEAYAAQYEREKLTLADVRLVAETAFSSRAAAVGRVERRARRAGAEFAAESAPRRLLERARYAASVMEGYTRAVHTHVVGPLLGRGLALEHFDEYLLALRVQGDRADLANPAGLRPESAGQVLDALRTQVGEEGFAAFETAAKRLADLREEWVIGPLAAAGVFRPEVIEMMRNNREYVRFDVVDYIDRNYGAGTGLKIHEQVGTLKDIASPLAATMARDMGFIGAVLRNEARRGMVGFLERFEPGAAVAAETRWVNNHLEALPPADRKTQGQIAYLEDGQLHTYNVDLELARAFEGFDQAAYAKIVPLATAVGDVFRMLFIHLRPGYPLFNLMRDTLRTVVNAPGTSAVWRIPANQVRAVRLLWQMRNGETPPVIEEMLRSGELLSRADRTDLLRFDRQTERLFAQFGIRLGPEHAGAPGWVRWLGTSRRGVQQFNEIVERMTKVAGELYLRERFPEMPAAEREHRVRTQLGSPDFLERGAASWVTNNLFLFSNAAVQGWKSDIEAMRNDKGVVAKRLALFVPYKTATWALKAGLAVALARLLWPREREDEIRRLEELEAVYQAIPQSDMANYLCIPLGVARLENGERGQVLYLRLPLDETTRLLNGVLHHSLESVAGQASTPTEWAQVLRIAADQLPSMNPVLELAKGTVDMLSGRNPVDSWTRRPVVDERVFAARSTPEANAWEQFGQWAWQKAGLGVFYNLQPDWKREEPDATGLAGAVQDIDRTPGLALLDDVVGRFLKVSDYGRAQAQQREAVEPQEIAAARRSVVRAILAERVAAGESLADLSVYEQGVWQQDHDDILDRARATLAARGLPADIKAIYDQPKDRRPYLQQWQAENPRP